MLRKANELYLSAIVWRGGKAGNFQRLEDGVFWVTRDKSVFERVADDDADAVKAFEQAYLDQVDAARPVKTILTDLGFDKAQEYEIIAEYLEKNYQEGNLRRMASSRVRYFVTGFLAALRYESLPENLRTIDGLDGFAAGLKVRPNR